MSDFHSIRGNPVIRSLVVLGMTLLVLILSAILLPPKGGSASPRDQGEQVHVPY
jgi:hypothetical protein